MKITTVETSTVSIACEIGGPETAVLGRRRARTWFPPR
jgi:hypothetical protein